MLSVVLIQQNIVWGNPQANRQHLDALLKTAPDADLYVLPEMFSTGFATDKDSVCEDFSSPSSLEWMKKLAAERNAAVAGSLAIGDSTRRYNRLFFVKPDGSVAWTDKRHLFVYGGEDKMFVPGNTRTVVEFRGVRFLLQVCYDLRFPVWSRNRGDYDAIIYTANWPGVRRSSWDVLIRARAIENQCFVVGVTRVGEDPVCEYSGGSVMVNPYGDVTAAAEDYKECLVPAFIDMENFASFRDKFPVLEDADDFTLNIE